MKVAIVGGGASALILASKIKSKDVTIFEKNNKLGKKLLLTGNGKCNFTNDYFDNLDYIYNSDFARNIYKKYDNLSCLEYFTSIGVEPKVEIHKGIKYYYPNSNKSTSVYYNLYDAIVDNNTNIMLDSNITSVSKDKNGQFIIYINNNEKYTFDKLIIATGGKSYDSTGSSGDGYKFARSFGHNVIEPIPGLCALKIDGIKLNGIKGTRVDACVNALINDKFVASEKGEMQFSDFGVSGIPVMNISNKINRYIGKYSIKLIVSFIDKEICKDALVKRKRNISYKSAIDFLCGLLPDEIAYFILDKCLNDKKKKVANITNEELQKIENELCSFTMNVVGFADFKSSQITLGGVDTSEVDNYTLESKKVDGLYFIGEVLNIDGICGGYNLQLAYSTASAVADRLNNL